MGRFAVSQNAYFRSMRGYLIGCLLFFLSFPFQLVGQELHCRVFLVDKGEKSAFVPESFFTQESIERRRLLGIAWTTEDQPVNVTYLESLSKLGNVMFQSRWFNMVSLETDSATLPSLNNLPFVQSVQCFDHSHGSLEAASRIKHLELADLDSSRLSAQTTHLEGDYFRSAGLDGAGVRIAVLDIGFKALHEVPALKHLKIIASRDFMSKKSKVFTYNAHGTQVMSCLAGIDNGVPMGLAPAAEYLLARTERNGEYRIEEESWIEAAEWADQLGARIISSSLGYSWQRYWKKEMNGQTALVSKAAAIATAKGMLIVASAGNAGDSDWRIIGAPADSDSVLAVGGVDPETGYHISFSSFGPNSLNHIKPNVSAFGKVYAATPEGLEEAEGTSFACPLISGFAACLLQHDSTLSPWQLRTRIEQSAHLYPYYDYAHGYGIPKASRALNHPSNAIYSDSMLQLKSDERGIGIYCSYPRSEKDTVASNPYDEQWYLYYHIADNTGKILRYRVVLPFQIRLENEEIFYQEVPEEDRPNTDELDALFIPLDAYPRPYTVRASFLGIYKTISIE